MVMSYSKLQIWTMASRPKTLWAAVSPVIIGTAMAYGSNGFHFYSAIAALFGALMIQIGTNFANDYFDFKKGIDRKDRLGPTRVTQTGLVSLSTMKTAIVVAFSLAFLAGIYLVWRGGLPIVIIGLSSILFGLLYTGGPYPLGYNGLGDIFVLLFFGPIAVGGTYFVQVLDISSEAIIAGFAPGLFSVAILTVNNLRDIKSDTITGKKTLQVRFGEEFSRLEYLFCILLSASIPVFLYYWEGSHPFATISILIIPLALPSIKKVFTLSNSPEFNDVLSVTGKLLLLYSVLFSIGWII